MQAARITIDGIASSRIFNVDTISGAGTNRDVTLSALTVTNGLETSSDGGGINIVSGSTLTLSDVVISGNTAEMGGGLFNEGTLDIDGSTILGNAAVCGAGVFNSGTATITSSTVSGNTANVPLAISCIGRGGGIFNYAGSATVTNSTISGNSAPGGGGGVFAGDTGSGSLSDSVTNILNTTITGNTAPSAGGLAVYDVSAIGNVTIANSIVAGNTAKRLAHLRTLASPTR